MKRYLLAKVIQKDDPEFGKVWTTNIENYRTKGTVQLIPTDETGNPRFNWAILVVTANNFTDILADPDIFALPDISLDSTVSVLSPSVRQAILTKLQSLGIDTSGITLQTTFRQVIRKIGRFLDISFSENNFDASE